VHIRWELNPAKSRHHTWALAMTVRAEIREGDRHADAARLQRDTLAHTHNTIHSTGIRRCQAAHQRSGTFSLHPKDTREEHRVEESAVAFVWPKNTSAEQERRWLPRWESRAEQSRAELHGVRAM